MSQTLLVLLGAIVHLKSGISIFCSQVLLLQKDDRLSTVCYNKLTAISPVLRTPLVFLAPIVQPISGIVCPGREVSNLLGKRLQSVRHDKILTSSIPLRIEHLHLFQASNMTMPPNAAWHGRFVDATGLYLCHEVNKRCTSPLSSFTTLHVLIPSAIIWISVGNSLMVAAEVLWVLARTASATPSAVYSASSSPAVLKMTSAATITTMEAILVAT